VNETASSTATFASVVVDREQASNISDDDEEEEEEREVINVFSRLSAAAESEDIESLPPQKLCGNHTLNLVASCDVTVLMRGKTGHTRDVMIVPWQKCRQML